VAVIRIMLVDDHEVVRTGLKTYLENQNGIEVVAEASSGEEALKLAPLTRPEVIVMDITMPGMGGIEATRRFVSAYPEGRILALTVHTDQQFFFEMMAAGATGYLGKQAAAEELVEAIRSVAHGQVYLQPVLARWLLEDYRRLLGLYERQEEQEIQREQKSADLEILSKREIQVLKLVSNSKSNHQIGEELGISPKTVSRHRERIMQKLNIHTSVELVKFAVSTGLIEIP
jgi:RNA polymerase sigma factor (sigma-70 family)